MSARAEQLFLAALSLPLEARADLTDRLVASLAEAIDPAVEQSHLEEVRQRIERIKSGETQLLTGEQVLSEGHEILATE